MYMQKAVQNTQENSAINMRKFAVQMQVYRAAIKEVQTKLEILDDAFNVQFEHNPIHHIESRLKSPASIIQKLERKGLPVNSDSVAIGVQDIAGIRVICNYIDDVWRVEQLLLEQDDVTLVKRKDYINNPKDNGYRSLHLIVSIPIFLTGGRKDTLVEVQIRTIAMDMWASLEHKLYYKSDSNIPENLLKRMNACSDALHLIDQEMLNIHQQIQKKNEQEEDA
ncbi:MAG: GTP pyrophosphokinase family protein [Clostridia bacterium]|nr:GTP pyrophosphokinase family protein [Clostridia bacterium]